MKLKVTVHGVAYEVEVEVLDPGEGFAAAGPLPTVSAGPPRSAPPAPPPPSAAPRAEKAPPGGSGGSVTCPIAGTVVEIKCRTGDAVREGQILLVVEAMKMNTSIAAPTSGKVKAIPVAVGDNVREGQVLVEYE
jgi:biotin carboxyl carrier protein